MTTLHLLYTKKSTKNCSVCLYYDMAIKTCLYQEKRFYNRETIRGIRMLLLAKIPPPLYHDWRDHLTEKRVYNLSSIEGKGGYEGHFLNYTILRGICFSTIKSLLFEAIANHMSVYKFFFTIIFLNHHMLLEKTRKGLCFRGPGVVFRLSLNKNVYFSI